MAAWWVFASRMACRKEPAADDTGADDSIVLNFEGADLREVVRNILGDILNESYTIDPSVGGQVTIRADLPLSSLSDYHTELKSLTQGQGSYTMEFSHYDPVPSSVQQELVKAYKSKDEE